MSTTPPPPPPPPTPPPPPPPPPPPLDESGGESGPGGGQLAEPWMRIGARLLDGLILLAISLAVVGVLVGTDGITAADDVSTGRVLIASAISLAIGFVWEAVLTKLKGGTPMKLAFGMKVVRAEDGGPVEWSHSIIRWGVPAAAGLLQAFAAALGVLALLALVIVSVVFIFTRPLRQAVWDLVAKTVVVTSR